MKTIKKLMSIVLVFIIALGTLSATASAKALTIKWDDFDEFLPVFYGGEVNVGSNVFATHRGNFAYKFTAPEEGLYCIDTAVNVCEILGDGYTITFVSEDFNENEVFGDKTSYKVNEKSRWCYYFEKGETQYIGIYSAGRFKNYDVNIEYLGKVTDFGFTENTPLQFNEEIWLGKDEAGAYCGMNAEVFFETDKGIKLTQFGIWFPVSEDTELTSGTNTFEVEFFGLKKEIEIEVFYLYDIIRSARTLEGFVSPTIYVIETENGEIALDMVILEDNNWEKIEITYSDGSAVTCKFGSYFYLTAECPDGKTICMPIEPVTEDGKYYFAIVLENGEMIIVDEAHVYNLEIDNGDVDVEPSYGPIMTLILRIVEFFRELLSKIFNAMI